MGTWASRVSQGLGFKLQGLGFRVLGLGLGLGGIIYMGGEGAWRITWSLRLQGLGQFSNLEI